MAPPPTRSEHHLVIGGGRADPAALLLVPEGSGWALPCVETDEQRPADAIPIVCAVRAGLGIEVSILRCLSDASGKDGGARQHVHHVEIHAGAAPPGRLVDRADLREIVLARPEHRPVIEAWLDDRERDAPPPDGRDWTRPGWRDEVITWVDRALTRRGLGRVATAEQIRVWEFSHVLRLTTEDGVVCFLKALPEGAAREPRVTRGLAERHPEWLPELLAVDLERRWMLMRRTAGPELMEVADCAEWEEAARRFATVQIAWISRGDELVALGCERRTLDWLATQVRPLLADEAALAPDSADALSAQQIAAARRRAPEIEALCGELADLGVPDSIEHGDLWATNVLAGPTGPVVIDWEDASVTHPFFSPALLFTSLEYTTALTAVADARDRIRAAYLAPWAAGPLRGQPAARIERAFDVAQRLAFLHFAVEFRRGLPRVETSREVKDFAPWFVKRLVSALG